jgi:hypothetical protein
LSFFDPGSKLPEVLGPGRIGQSHLVDVVLQVLELLEGEGQAFMALLIDTWASMRDLSTPSSGMQMFLEHERLTIIQLDSILPFLAKRMIRVHQGIRVYERFHGICLHRELKPDV